MSNLIDITKADPANEDLMQRLDAWCSKTEQEAIKLPRNGNVWVLWRGTDIACVYVFKVEPVVSMMFDREGPAMQTIRCFDLVRAVMQANGVKPLVFVDERSPLLEISGKRMTEVSNRRVYRM